MFTVKIPDEYDRSVDMNVRWCSCGLNRDLGRPYIHMFAVISQKNIDIRGFLDVPYRLDEVKRVYTSSTKLCDFSELEYTEMGVPDFKQVLRSIIVLRGFVYCSNDGCLHEPNQKQLSSTANTTGSRRTTIGV